jgi:hypothetical protein
MLAHRQEDPPARTVDGPRVPRDRRLERGEGLGRATLPGEDYPEVAAIGEVGRVAIKGRPGATG